MKVINKFLSESKNVQRLFRLSYMNYRGLKPWIPDNMFTKLNIEDNKIPRIPFCPSIDHCTLALGYNTIKDNPKEYFVYEPLDYSKLKLMTNKEIVKRHLINDANITKEFWILNPIKVKKLGTIKILGVTNKCYSVYDNQGREIAEQCVWRWKWVK